MPGLGSSAFNTAGQITSLVRSLLNDVAGHVYNDVALLPYLNSAYRKVQRSIANIAGATFIEDDVLMILPAVVTPDPSMQTILSDTGYFNGTSSVSAYGGAPTLIPSDMVAPLKLWERQSGSSDDFDDMIDLTDRGGLPSNVQGPFFIYWELRSDGICFLGATEDQQIRLRYKKSYPDLTDPTSVVLVRNAQEAIAYFTASLAAGARGAPQADKWTTAAEDALEDLLQRETHQLQSRPRRRRPYGRRGGYGPLV